MPIKKTDLDTVLLQTLMLFRAKGYCNTSMADIARACGLLKGSLYHYFPSKHALAEKVLEYVYDYFEKEGFAQSFDEGIPARERLVKMIGAVEGYFSQDENGCVMNNLIVESVHESPQIREQVARYFDRWQEALVYLLRKRYPEAEAVGLSEDIMARTQGAVLLRMVRGERGALKRVQAYVDTLLEE